MRFPFYPLSVSNLAVCDPEVPFDFGDKRLYAVSIRLFSSMLSMQSAVAHRFCTKYSDLKASYRLFCNMKVKVEELMNNSFGLLIRSIKDRDVLLLCDTTSINCSAAAGGMTEQERIKLGVLENNLTPGYYAHASLCIDAKTSDVYGLTDVIMFNRMKRPEDGKESKQEKRNKEYAQKETSIWEQGCVNSLKYLQKAKRVTAVFDRGADRFEVLQRTLNILDLDAIFRISHDRIVMAKEEKCKLSELAAGPVQGTYQLKIKQLCHKTGAGNKRKYRAKRTGTMELRWHCIDEIVITKEQKRYKSLKGKGSIKRKLYFIDTKEILAPKHIDEEPVHWQLITTHPVESQEDALRIIGWYQQRWHIEQLFRTLKTKGMELEDSRLQTVDGLMKNGVLAFAAACTIMQLNLARGIEIGLPIEVVFEQEEISLLTKLNSKLQGKTALQKNPYKPTQLSYATWIMGRLGGWKGYYSQGPPGPTTISKGYFRFQTMMEGIRMIL